MQYLNGFVYSGQWAADMPVLPQPSSPYARLVTAVPLVHRFAHSARAWPCAHSAPVPLEVFAGGLTLPLVASSRRMLTTVVHAVECAMLYVACRVSCCLCSTVPASLRSSLVCTRAIVAIQTHASHRRLCDRLAFLLGTAIRRLCQRNATQRNATHPPDCLAVRHQAKASRAHGRTSAGAGGKQAVDTLVATWERGRTSGTAASSAAPHHFRRSFSASSASRLRCLSSTCALRRRCDADFARRHSLPRWLGWRHVRRRAAWAWQCDVYGWQCHHVCVCSSHTDRSV